MIATIINVALILVGSAIGLLIGDGLKERVSKTITEGLALCVAVIAVMNAIGTTDILGVIICVVIGTLIGEWINIEKRLDVMGERLKQRLAKSGKAKSKGLDSFTQAFVTASLLYCVGAMAVTGSLQAGINQDYSILISKGVIDGVTSITFAATLGIGVVFSVLPLFLYQGSITLLAAVAAPYLGGEVVTQMTAVGGVIMLGIAMNIMKLKKEPVRVGNMLPAIFLPILYVPFSAWFTMLPIVQLLLGATI